MSHSQWEKKKLKKALNGKDTHKIFTKMVRLIMAEAKQCGGDRESPGLKAAISKAKREGLPSENIDRAIKKASEPGEQMETITYEAYGPGGVGLIIETLTDSRNRTAQDVKHILSENGCSLGGVGSVVWAFEKPARNADSIATAGGGMTPEGIIWKPTSTIPLSSEEEMAALEKLINELENNDDVQEVYTNAE